MGVLAPSAVEVPITKCEVKNGKKRPREIMRTLSQILCVRSWELLFIFCVSRFGAYLRFYCYQYRDHSASRSR